MWKRIYNETVYLLVSIIRSLIQFFLSYQFIQCNLRSINKKNNFLWREIFSNIFYSTHHVVVSTNEALKIGKVYHQLCLPWTGSISNQPYILSFQLWRTLSLNKHLRSDSRHLCFPWKFYRSKHVSSYTCIRPITIVSYKACCNGTCSQSQ